MATTNGRGETSSDLQDRIHTPLNACSLEVLHEQCRRYPESDADGGAEGGAWPLVVGCYQLNEARGGRLALYFYNSNASSQFAQLTAS